MTDHSVQPGAVPSASGLLEPSGELSNLTLLALLVVRLWEYEPRDPNLHWAWELLAKRFQIDIKQVKRIALEASP